jgi:hypothetical protein
VKSYFFRAIQFTLMTRNTILVKVLSAVETLTGQCLWAASSCSLLFTVHMPV